MQSLGLSDRVLVIGQTEYTSFAKRFALASTTIFGNPECRRGTKEIDGEVSLESETVLAPGLRKGSLEISLHHPHAHTQRATLSICFILDAKTWALNPKHKIPNREQQP